MNNKSPIDVPEAFFKFARWLNAETLSLGPRGMIEEAASGTLTSAERDICRAFVDTVLQRVTDDQKLLDFMKTSGAKLFIKRPAGARYLLKLIRDTL